MERLAAIPAVLSVLCAAGVAFAAGPKPEWTKPEFPSRAVFSPRDPGREFTLLLVPPDESFGRPDGVTATDEQGEPVQFRVVQTNRHNAIVLVKTGVGKGGHKFALYYGGNYASGAAGQLADTDPVRVDIFQAPGQGIPETWPRMRYLFVKASSQTDVEHLPGFRPEVIAGEGQRGKRKRDREHRWIVRMSTFVHCEKPGRYRFGVRCRNSAFMFLDGAPAATRLMDAREGTWTEGAPIDLEPGVYRLDVYHCTGPQLAVEAGWILPGEDKMSRIPDRVLVTSGEAADARLERMDRAIHADFAWDMKPSYAYRGSAATFIPVQFRSTSETWIDPATKLQWEFGDGCVSEEPAPVHVYTSPAIRQVTLRVRDTMGFTGLCGKRVDCSLTEPEVLRIGGGAVGIAPVFFPGDRIEGGVEIGGDMPPAGELVLEKVIRETDAEYTSAQAMKLPYRWETPGRAGTVKRISWNVRHHGSPVAVGAVRFLGSPFEVTPVTIRGESLIGPDGVRLVMVPSVEDDAGRQYSWPRPLGGTVMFVGDDPVWESVAGRNLASSSNAIMSCAGADRLLAAKLDPWDSCPDAYGPLLKLVQVPALVQPGTRAIILSIGFADFLAGTSPAEFERQVAALTDILFRSMKLNVMWVTLPPYGANANRAAPYAEAVIRVAYRRRIPVADLFSAFMARGGDEPLFDASGLSLSRSGEHLAFRVLKEAIARVSEVIQ